MLAVIDANGFYVQAFLRETFVGNLQKGDRAVVTLMSYPDTTLRVASDSIGWGIAQQNGSSGFEQLPSVKPTFEWIRLAQRIPVAVRREGSRQHQTPAPPPRWWLSPERARTVTGCHRFLARCNDDQ
jgi:multidrug resistance efflux pump